MSEEPESQPVRRSLTELLYRSHEGGDSDDLALAASGWLDAVHAFGVDALAAV